MTDQDLVRTRIALHAVGELVMAGPQYRASDTIRLRVAPGGFRTWAAPELAVDGADLVAPGTRIPVSGRTARELASAVGVDAGAPAGLYADGSGVGPDETLVVDQAAAARLADAYGRGAAALRLLAPGVEPVLWPEHFDLAVAIDGVTYGVSPGDDDVPEPYAYVGVDPVPADDPYWNAPFGAARPMTGFADADSLREFFVDARRHPRWPDTRTSSGG